MAASNYPPRSHLCAEPTKFLAATLVSLSAMLHLELPHVNVLSKVDLLERYGRLHFRRDTRSQ